MHSSKRDMLSERIASLYAYGHTVRVWYTKLYHTRTVHTIRVWYVPYAYGIKYAYGTEQLDFMDILMWGFDASWRLRFFSTISLQLLDFQSSSEH